MKSIVLSFLLALPLTLVPNALAQNEVFNIDSNASQVAFTLGDVLHTVHGTFHVQSGSIDFDRSAQKISGSIVVAAGSGNSGDKARDHRMNTNILEVQRFAQATFVPHSYQGTIAPTGDSTIQVAGTFTLHGTPHELTVPMQIHIEGNNCTAKGQFTVPYVKWGLKDPSNFLLHVAKEVAIDVTLVGHVAPSK
ncbi:MAG: YceI family protein [Acidobacteriaceae bacterium]